MVMYEILEESEYSSSQDRSSEYEYTWEYEDVDRQEADS